MQEQGSQGRGINGHDGKVHRILKPKAAEPQQLNGIGQGRTQQAGIRLLPMRAQADTRNRTAGVNTRSRCEARVATTGCSSGVSRARD